ncbi:MAG: molybdopterin-dependent oxidoreductase [Rhodospirillales bacterium]|nr:molybdopterin-dependent oxidoreductase [Rhodospirillales bacterium]
MDALPSPLGQALPRREDARLLRGLGRFHDDIDAPRALHAAFARSPHAAARIVAIDTASARAMPGVVAVLTGADLARLATPLRLAPPVEGLHPVEMPPMPIDAVRMVGDPVALVVAQTRIAAEGAAEALAVTWEPTEAVASVEAASRPGAPRVDPSLPSNLVSHQTAATPGLAAAFAAAPRIVTARFVQQRQTHVPMESRGCLAEWDPGRAHLTMTVGTQAPHPYRTALAARLGLSEAQVTVRSPDMGGGFGQKIVLMREELACAAAARLLARTVRWRESRGENLAASLHAREDAVGVRAAVTEDGTILALDVTLDQDFGAWCFFPANYMARMILLNLTGPYRIRELGTEVRVWLTNKCPSGPMRAPMAIVSWVTEGTIEAVARELGHDPLEIRRRNMLTARELPFASPGGQTLDAITPRETLEAVAAAIDYPAARAHQRAAFAQGRLLGIGLCAALESTTYGSAFFRAAGVPGSGHEVASVRIEPSGAVLAACGLMGSGQGYETSLAQTVAAGLGAAVRDVTMQMGDSDVAPYGMGSRGARGGTAGGSALFLAGQKLRAKVLAIAADMLGLNSAEAITLHESQVLRRTESGWAPAGLTLPEIARRAHLDPLRLPAGMEPGLHAILAYDPPPMTFSNSTHACLIEIDRDTGEVSILRYVCAEDVGQAINPIVVEGQTQGAIALGLSGALMERAAYGTDGQFLSGSFMDYALIRAGDMPALEISHMNTPTPRTPAGIKGMAEGGVLGAIGALMNAVNDALAQAGARLDAQPASPPRVWAALRAAEAAVQASEAAMPR